MLGMLTRSYGSALPFITVGLLAFLACSDHKEIAATPAAGPDAEPPAMPQADSDAPKSFDVAAIDAWVARRVKSLGLVGVSLAIARDGKIVLAKGYGRKSVAAEGPVTPQTSFAIGSLTKQFTCASVLLLAEEGKVSLDDKVSKYYPELTGAADITLDDALSHRAGYPDYYPLDFVDERMAKATTPEAIVNDYAKKPLDFGPRAHWSYSNTGFLIAGNVVEKVSGESFGAFVGKRIFAPVGMPHSSLGAKELDDVASGHTTFALGETEVATPEADGWLHAAGGIYASAEDIAKWDLALADKTVLKPSSFDAMTAPRRLGSGAPVTYACGLGVSQRNGETILHHGGAVSGFLSQNALLPRTRSAVVLLSNADHIDGSSIHSTILSLLLSADGGQRTIAVAGPPPADVARDLLHQMQKGAVDRTRLGEPFSHYLTDARLKAAAPRLAALGEPEIFVSSVSERGGAENAHLKLVFKTATVWAVLHRSPDGKIQQFLLTR